MTGQTPEPSPSGRLREAAFAGLMLALGAAGLLDIRYGNWRPGPGIGNHLVPMVAYWVLVGAAAAMLAGLVLRLRREAETEKPLQVRALPVLGGLIWALGFYWCVRHVGIAVSTALFMGVAMAALAPLAHRSLPRILGVAVAAGGFFWLLFTQLAPILVTRQLLF